MCASALISTPSPPQDIVTRYAHQTGYHVERTFGWDCHGLPVEYEIDKTLGIRVSTTLVDPLLLFLFTLHSSCLIRVLCDVCVHIAHHNVLLHSPPPPLPPPLPSPPLPSPLPPPTQGPEDVAAMGIAKYNAECRKIVMRYSKEWQVGGHAHWEWEVGGHAHWEWEVGGHAHWEWQVGGHAH